MALTEEQREIALMVAESLSSVDSDYEVRVIERFLAALPKPEAPLAKPASAPSEQKPRQPWPNHNWCVGCFPDSCQGCGTEPIERRAPQPDYKAQRDAGRLDYLQVNGATVSLVHLKNPNDFEFCVGGLYKSINCDLRTAIDAAIASAKGGA